MANATEEIDEEQKCTLWVGGLDEKVDEEILYELFQNAGPLVSVRIPTDRETKRQKPFGFILFEHSESVPFAVDLFRDVRLFGKQLRMQNKATGAGMPNRQLHQRSMSAPQTFSRDPPSHPQHYPQGHHMHGQYHGQYQQFAPPPPMHPQYGFSPYERDRERRDERHRSDHRSRDSYRDRSYDRNNRSRRDHSDEGRYNRHYRR